MNCVGLTTFVTSAAHWSLGQAARRRPRVPQPGPVGQLGRLSETPVAFAGAGRASTETVIAFAGANWGFLVHFRVQRWCRFQQSLVGGEQWCCWFQCRHVVSPRARNSSPCAPNTPQIRRFFALTGTAPRSCGRRGALQAAVVGVLHYTEPSDGVSPECRSPV